MAFNDQKKINEKMQALSLFSSRVVHDLNNFSTIIVNVCELIKDDIAGNSEAEFKMKMVEEVGERLLSYTQEMGELKLREIKDSQKCAVGPVLDEFVQNHEHKSSIKLSRENFQHLEAHLSKEHVEKIVSVLVDNAKNASKENTPVSIFARSNEQGGFDLVVENDGDVIDQETLDRFCEPYFTTKGNVKGVGLSLSKIYALLKNRSGDLKFEGKESGGVKAIVSFPQSQLEESASKNPSKESETQEEKSLQPEILLVDDEDPLRRVAFDILQRSGFHVVQAANGVDALKVADEHKEKINLLITDLEMPQMSGRELAKKLSEKDRNLKVLFMSGYQNDGSFPDNGEGQFGFVDKPFTKDRLLSAVNKILHR